MHTLTINKSGLYAFVPDIHYPEVHYPSFNALLEFLDHNTLAGVILAGDMLHNNSVSHHNRKKIIFREAGAYARDITNFDKHILTPIEQRLSKSTQRFWLDGNHERFITDLVESNPELQGTVEHHKLLRLDKRRWQYLPLGGMLKLGSLTCIHGDQLSGANPTKKALESFGSSVIMGHFHTPSSSTMIRPFDATQKHQAWVSPVLGSTNPGYIRHRPNSWVNGFSLIDFASDGLFNVSLLTMTNGQFRFAGKTYGRKSSKS